ncbi:MAG: PIN domain-containing protein, partial [Bacteroidota bacterium]
MKLVLDSNILFSAILKNSTTRNILVSEEFELFLSEYALLEIDNHRQFLLDKTKLSESAFTTTL